jgi:hypothetical protein
VTYVAQANPTIARRASWLPNVTPQNFKFCGAAVGMAP